MKFNYLFMGLLALWLTASCSDASKSVKNDQKELPVVTITAKDTLINSQYVADIQAKKNIEIRSRIGGIIQSISVNEGQFVRKGQTLFKINDAELRMELNKIMASSQQADADIKMAKIEVNQLQSLYDKKFIAANELELSKAKLASANAKKSYVTAELNAIRQKIEFTNISAPFDGVIDVIPFKEGSLIETDALLTTLSQLDEVYAYFSIPENLYFDLISTDKLNQYHKIELVLPNQEHYDFKGTLKTAEGEIDPNTGSIRYKVVFPNPKKMIKHGTSGKLVITETVSNAITIPQKSTFSIQDKVYVFAVDNDLKVKMTPIEIQSTLSNSYLLANGVKPGDRIVEEGTQSLRDGDQIKIKNRG